MVTRLLAPSMGEGITELTVVNWLKKEGDPVRELEGIVELETDKVTTEIPSPATGIVLKILAHQNEPVKVGSTLAWIGQPGEALESMVSHEEVVKPVPIKPIGTGWVSPLVRKLATSNHIDLSQVIGTGQGGRITKDDVLKFLDNNQPIAPQPGNLPVETTDASDIPSSIAPDSSDGELIPLTSMRRRIAERMVFSWNTSPHVMTVMEADLSRVLAHKGAHKSAYQAQGVDLTLTAYFCAAIIKGLKACPDVNAAWMEAGIRRYHQIHLGIATSLGDEGLIVPVIKNADMLSLQGLAQKVNDLSARARSRKLAPEEVKGGTFTLTNLGRGGSLFASPIIVQPQAAILGVGRQQKRVVVVADASGADAIAIRPMVYLSLVFDHRMLDGEGGDRFLSVVKDELENWD